MDFSKNNLSDTAGPFLIDDYDYFLPEELIAQSPAQKRDNSRLFVLSKDDATFCHRHFFDIKDYIKSGDILVINDSKVIPARLIGHRYKNNTDGTPSEQLGAQVELLLLAQREKDVWETLVRPGHKMLPGTRFNISGKLFGEVLECVNDGNRLVKFEYEGEFFSILDEIGEMPLPPYIHERSTENERYQTVYAKYIGSSAAPTAGLHFTKELMEEIKNMGVTIVPVTLHVGLGTFRPVKVTNIKEHKMHSEFYSVSRESADAYNEAKKKGGRVFCVGTTSCRTLESACDENGYLCEKSGNTDIFIYPGYKFRAVEALITNFHLPKSTLIMLVSAFAGRENVLSAYNEAVKNEYRFFSFGDAMLII